MRLINTKTLKLVDIIGQLPQYGILSHCWRRGEVSHHDYHVRDPWRQSRQREGFTKIRSACDQARNDGIEYMWIDTCCIDKTSSAELGEAINSMYSWYKKAAKCYVYLDDVVSPGPATAISPALDSCATTSGTTSVQPQFAASRWFTRGWTLQELLAPRNVCFYDSNWTRIGEKSSLVDELHRITGIDTSALEGGPLRQISVGRRMSWASARRTTRIEDMAYCLLGIFNVNMPMLYGEGKRAFIRLQQEILRNSEDQTLLAWQCTHNSRLKRPVRGLLATSPADFACFSGPMTLHAPTLFGQPAYSADEETRRVYVKQVATPVPFRDFDGSANSLVARTNRGLRITAAVEDLSPTPMDSILLGLNCSVDGRLTKVVGIYLQRHDGDRYVRVRPDELGICPSHSPRRTIFGLQTDDEIDEEVKDESPNPNFPSLSDNPAMRKVIQPKDLFHRRSSLQHAFYISNTTMPALWTTYYVFAVFSKSEHSSLNPSKIFHHPLGTHRSHCAVVIETDWKTRGGQYRGGMLVKTRLAAESFLIVFGADWNNSICSPVPVYDCWFDVIAFPDKASTPSMAEMENIVAETPQPATSFIEKTVTGVASSNSLLLSVKAAKVQGLDMFCIEIRENKPSDEDVVAPWSGFPPGQGLVVVSGSSQFFVPAFQTNN